MTLPIHTRLLMVAETLDGLGEATTDAGADVHAIAQGIEQEAQVLRDMAVELNVLERMLTPDELAEQQRLAREALNSR